MTADQLYLGPIHVDGAQRATTGTDLIRFCWKGTAQHHLRPFTITFEWFVGATLVWTDTQTEANLRVTSPSYSPGEPQLPGADAGKRSPTTCFVTSKLASDLPVGIVSIVATIRSGAFSYTYPKPIRAINHRDGTAMPCSLVRYIDTVNGNDANGGTSWVDAVRTMDRAIATMRTDFTYAGSDLAGGTINVRGILRGNQDNYFHCSAPGWLHIVADSGAKFQSGNPPLPSDSFRLTWQGVSGSGAFARLHFVGFETADGTPGIQTDPNTIGHVWADNCVHHVSTFDPQKGHTVRWYDSVGNAYANSGGGVLFTYFTGHRGYGLLDGISGYEFAHDCRITDYAGVGLYHNGRPTAITIDCTASRQRSKAYENPVSQGYVPTPGSILGAFDVYGTAAAPLRASMVAGVLVIESPIGFDFAAHVNELVPSANPGFTPYFGVNLSGFTTPGLNGITRQVLGGGLLNGRTYVLLDGAGVTVPAPELAPSGRVFTAKITPGPSQGFDFRYHCHSDGFYLRGPRDRDIAMVHLYDYDNQQVVFFREGIKERSWLEVAAAGGGTSPMDNDVRNCLFRNWSHRAALFMLAGTGRHAGTAIENCAIENMTGGIDTPTALAASGMIMRHCHLVQGTVIGAGTTTGPAWVGNSFVAPFHLPPLPVLIGSGLPQSHEPQFFAWLPGTPSKGAHRHYAMLSWSLPVDEP